MPLSSYFKGGGAQVMAEMLKRYGKKKGKSIFYGTAQAQAQAQKQKPKRP